jgi:hypothetical protein
MGDKPAYSGADDRNDQEPGVQVKQLCRKHSWNRALFYKLKTEFDHMDLSDGKGLNQLEARRPSGSACWKLALHDVALKELLESLPMPVQWWNAVLRAMHDHRPPTFFFMTLRRCETPEPVHQGPENIRCSNHPAEGAYEVYGIRNVLRPFHDMLAHSEGVRCR